MVIDPARAAAHAARLIAALAAAIAFAQSEGCGSSTSSGASSSGTVAHIVRITLVGSPEAFEQRRILVEGQALGAAQRFNDLSALAGHDVFGASIELCTTNRDRFLHALVEVEVFEGEELLWSGEVERVGCQFSPDEVGEKEDDRISLNDDGSIDADPEGNPLNESSCYPPGRPVSCGDRARF